MMSTRMMSQHRRVVRDRRGGQGLRAAIGDVDHGRQCCARTGRGPRACDDPAQVRGGAPPQTVTDRLHLIDRDA
jgi:hypothetical protein